MVKAVTEMNLTLQQGEKLAVVGESGSGKSQCWLGVMGLLAHNARVTGRAEFGGRNLLEMSSRQLDRIRGREMSMVFQDPMTALNPTLRISRQLTEPLEVHFGMGRAAAEKRAIAMLERVGIPDPVKRFRLYPHELSGGMRQRILIASAFAAEPKLIIADEPTTALDVTVQKQILKLIREMQQRHGTALLFVTHDLGVVSKIAQSLTVLYAGKVIEETSVENFFAAPSHAYSKALLAATPKYTDPQGSLTPVPEGVTKAVEAEVAAFDAQLKAGARP
ncbi:MAG: ABC transporter ATP-binding protein [Roseitalea porphyridii]